MSGQPDERDRAAPPAEPAPGKRPYAPPELVEYGSVARLTAAKSGAPTDAGMPMNVCL